MKHTLADTIGILLPCLSPALGGTPALASRLQKLARALPPIHRGGFEYRLGANAPQVDFAQAILGYDGEPAVLIEHIARMTSADSGPIHPAWNRLYDFCTRWIEPTSLLHGRIRTIWLELDVDTLTPDAPAPSLFFTLKPDVLTVAEACAVAEDALGVLLSGPAFSALRGSVRRCFEACADIARVWQVGVMLARQTEALRFCVKPLAPEHVIPYLERVGWPGPVDELLPLLEQLLGLVDRIDMVDLDVGAQVYPKIGLECVFEKQPPREPRWAAFLDHLVVRGLCTPGKRDVLLAWPGYTDPDPGPLPQLPDRFGAFKRRVSHVKIVAHPQRPPEAKAYLWFDHVWLELQPAQPVDGDRS